MGLVERRASLHPLRGLADGARRAGAPWWAIPSADAGQEPALGLDPRDERFHRTLAAEGIGRRGFADLADCQRRLDRWREVYNTERPHEAIDLATPITRYQPSPRAFPERIEAFDYGAGTLLRRVGDTGGLCFKGRKFRLGRAFIGRQVALRPTLPHGSFAVLFCGHQVGTVDLRQPAP